MPGFVIGSQEAEQIRTKFQRKLTRRLRGAMLMISDTEAGIKADVKEVLSAKRHSTGFWSAIESSFFPGFARQAHR
ncbi:hypothetical protein FQ320_02150 [Oceaniovalibus sp. ACAM 378]|nr:hypothetical protein FQ320_02150 [Oceaniovalibus sp. ACAM 378]